MGKTVFLLFKVAVAATLQRMVTWASSSSISTGRLVALLLVHIRSGPMVAVVPLGRYLF
jgi:hypothetical protein